MDLPYGVIRTTSDYLKSADAKAAGGCWIGHDELCGFSEYMCCLYNHFNLRGRSDVFAKFFTAPPCWYEFCAGRHDPVNETELSDKQLVMHRPNELSWQRA